MKYTLPGHFLTGVGIPLFSLRSAKSCGIGEFSDLKLFGQWCSEVNLDLIYLLPVNDTGENPSPYSALSAFALNPIFLSLRDIPFLDNSRADIENFSAEMQNFSRLQYQKVLRFKLETLEAAYHKNAGTILASAEFQLFLKDNDWIYSYSIFKFLKKAFGSSSWKSWPKMIADKTRAELCQIFPDLNKIAGFESLLAIIESRTDHLHQDFFLNNIIELGFYAWLQQIASEQLAGAAKLLRENKIALKGDIPIMMEEDSVDVWLNPSLFLTHLRAGAPPDQFSVQGQNWVFPVYNWPEHERSSLKWWSKRLHIADRYYQAYRIDHVLGFYRIWCMPQGEETGMMGSFFPSAVISHGEFEEYGFSGGQLHYLNCCHVPGQKIRDVMGISGFDVFFEQVNNEDLFILNQNYDNEKKIQTVDNPLIREFLLEVYHNSTLLKREGGFVFSWYFENTTAYLQLDQRQKDSLNQLYQKLKNENMLLHEAQGLRLLNKMKQTTSMLVCAEDLGAVEPYVPKTLKQLDILSLKVERWHRNFHSVDREFIAPEDYPRESFSMSSVHDSSTIRGWCFDRTDDFELYCESNGIVQNDLELKPENAIKIVQRNLKSNSILAILFIQDLLAMEPRFIKTSATEERINIPGLVSDENWSYRMPVSLEELSEDKKFIALVADLISQRRSQTLVG